MIKQRVPEVIGRDTFNDHGVREVGGVDVLILAYLLKFLLKVLLWGWIAAVGDNEVGDWALNKYHVVEVELGLAVDLRVGEQSILDNSDEAIELCELLLKLGLAIAHY